MIIIKFEGQRIDKYKLAEILCRLIPILVYCNRYLKKFEEIMSLESKITLK